MTKIQVTLMPHYKIRIRILAKNKIQKRMAIDVLKRMPVIEFNEKYRCYESYLFHYNKLMRLCEMNNYNLFISNKTKYALEKLNQRINAFSKAKEDKTFKSLLWTEDPNYQVFPYQAQAINVCFRAKRYLIGDDMGIGKTITAMGIVCLALEDGYKKIMILCPNRLKYQWLSEFKQFTKINEKDIVVISAGKKFVCPQKKNNKPHFAGKICKECGNIQKCKLLKTNPQKRITCQFEDGKIFLINYELMDRIKDFIIKENFDCIILDEATRVKNVKAQTTKAMTKIIDNMPSDAIVIPMSGTFIENRIEEIYPSLNFVHKGLLGQYHSFTNRYIIKDFFNNVIGVRNGKSLKKIINNWIIRRSIDEVWKDRPPLKEVTKSCPMPKEQLKIYLDAKEGCLRDLNDKEKERKINMAEVGALLNYLIQICDSAETMDQEVKVSGKINALKEIVEEEISKRHKVVIFSFFANKVIPIIKRELSKYGKCLTITGNNTPEESERIKQRFKRCRDYRFLICSDSMAYGANMQFARYVINFDLLWNPAKIDQRIRRVYRKGQTHPVTVINLVTTGTIEDMILEKLGNKRKLFEEFLGTGIKERKNISLSEMVQILKAKPVLEEQED